MNRKRKQQKGAIFLSFSLLLSLSKVNSTNQFLFLFLVCVHNSRCNYSLVSKLYSLCWSKMTRNWVTYQHSPLSEWIIGILISIIFAMLHHLSILLCNLLKIFIHPCKKLESYNTFNIRGSQRRLYQEFWRPTAISPFWISNTRKIAINFTFNNHGPTINYRKVNPKRQFLCCCTGIVSWFSLLLS